MAHFAQLDSNNNVVNVIVVNNNAIKDANGVEQESLGVAFCQNLYGANTVWKQTSYNGSFRNKFASKGDFYNQSLDVFMMPKPYPSWTANTAFLKWDPPVPEPYDLNVYNWNEAQQKWVLAHKTAVLF